MTDVFISYKRRLRPRVEAIAVALRRLGLTVWYDAALEAGTSFSAEISNQVRTAGCVLVCWSDDAFPHGGDRTGWVIGEATIGQERGCLVPVLLEEVVLDPPWNTLHAGSLVDWVPEAPAHAGWRGMLAAIGHHLGRADLVDADAALNAGLLPLPVVAPRAPALTSVAIAALGGAVMTAIGAVILAGVDPQLRSSYFSLVPGVALYALPLAVLFARAGALSVLKAGLLVLAFVVAFAVAVGAGIVSLIPLHPADPSMYDLAEIVLCTVAGVIGAFVSLGAFPLLGLVTNNRRTWLRIAASSIVLAAIAAIVAAMPFFNLEIGNSAIIWLAAVWQLVYAPALVFVLRAPRR